MLNANNISADHMDVKVSLIPRVDITAQDMRARTPVKARIEYLKWGKRKINNKAKKSNTPYMSDTIGQL